MLLILYMSGSQTIHVPIKYANTNNSTSTSTGSIVIYGGVGVSGKLYSNNELHLLNSLTSNTLNASDTTITSTQNATSLSTGSVIVAGGMSVSENIHTGNEVNIHNISDTSKNSILTTNQSGALLVNDSPIGSFDPTIVLNLTNTTQSSDTNSGALTSLGGVAIAKNINVAGIAQIQNTTDASNTQSGSLQVSGGGSIIKDMYIGDSLNANSLNILNTTSSSSTNTGALVVSSGISINGNLDISNSLDVNTDTTFSNTVTGVTRNYDDNTTYVATTGHVYSAVHTPNTVMADPTGFENTTDSVINYDPATRVLSISPVSASYNVWIDGVRFTKSSTINMAAHASTAGVKYYYYFDNTGTLQMGTSFPNFYLNTMVSIVYYYSSTIYMYTEERHGTVMNPATHLELHNTIGTYYVSGLVAANFTLSPTTPLDSHNTFSITSGVIADEDLNSSITATNVGGAYTILQLNGTSGVIFWTLTNTVPFYYAAGSYIQYNQLNGSSWQLTALASNNWMNYYVMFTPSLTSSTQTLIIPGQQVYNSLTNATGETFASLSLGTFDIPEYLALYQITFRTSSGYTNTGKCSIEAFNRISGTKITISNNPTTNHNALSGLQLSDDGVSYGHINDQTGYFAGSKTFVDTTQSTSTSTGGIIISGGVNVGSMYVGGSVYSPGITQLTNTTQATS